MKDLQLLYTSLEEVAITPTVTMSLTTVITKFIGDPEKVDPALLELAQFENGFLSLVLNETGLKAQYIGTDNNGLPYEYPDIKKFSEQQLDYLETRYSQVQISYLKSRYAHILWLSPRKKIEHAKSVIDGYLSLADYSHEREKIESGKAHYQLAVNFITNALNLSLSVKYRKDESKERLLDMLSDLDNSTFHAPVYAMKLTNFMLGNKKIFKNEDFQGVTDTLNSQLKTLKPNHNHLVEELLEVILKVEQKLCNDLSPWHELMGQAMENETKSRENGSFVTTDFCRKAIESYRQAGNEVKVKELTELYEKLKREVNLDTVGHDIDISEYVSNAKKIANELSKESTVSIMRFLANDPDLIPSKEKVMKMCKEEGANSFMFMVNSSVIDDKGNTPKYYTTQEEKEFEQLLFYYSFEIQLWHFTLLREIINSCVYEDKLSYGKVLEYLSNNSWFGQELETHSLSGSENEKWLAQIAPSIVEFFMCLERVLYFKEKSWMIVTSFDSLVVKIEGLLRTLAEYVGIQTSQLKKDKLGRNISEEKDIMRLLTDPDLVSLIGEDDALYLRFILTEKSGFNLRNKVAHGLMKYNDYSLGTLMFVFLAVIRLSRFKLKDKAPQEAQ